MKIIPDAVRNHPILAGVAAGGAFGLAALGAHRALDTSRKVKQAAAPAVKSEAAAASRPPEEPGKALGERVTALEISIQALTNAVAATEPERLAAFETSLADLEERLNEGEAAVAAAATAKLERAAAKRDRFTAFEASLAALEERVSGGEAAVAAAATAKLERAAAKRDRFAAFETSLADLGGRVTGGEATVAALQKQMDDNPRGIAELTRQYQATNKAIKNLEAEIAKKMDLTALTASLRALEGRVTTLEHI